MPSDAILGSVPLVNRDPWEMDISLLEDGANAALATWTRALLGSGPEGAPPALPQEVARELAEQGPVAIGVWVDGQSVVQEMRSGDRSWAEGMQALAAAHLPAIRLAEGQRGYVAFALGHDPVPLNFREGTPERRELCSNIHRGMWGLHATFDGRSEWISPFEVIMKNRGFRVLVEELGRAMEVPASTFQERVELVRWKTHHMVVELHQDRPTVPMHRASRLVHPKQITREGVQALADRMGDYLFRHVNEEGALTYIYEPARGEDVDGGNNMIRQWMATVCMNRVAADRGNDRELYAVVEKNIRHNLRRFYRPTGSAGVIEYDDKVKLGAVALAVQALIEHPKQAEFARYANRLLKSVDRSWEYEKGSGRFLTLMKPVNRNMGHNFYPGEALLTWSMVYQRDPSKKLLDRFMKSYQYYRFWHVENRNPAFIPWHTQAYFNMWEILGDRELANWTFEMNDWLIEQMLQVHSPLYPDIAGRFYNPRKPKFGTPHASSTGVYMEGLIDAFEMADRLGDTVRRERYRLALCRGIRSCWQLTFTDELEAFYAQDPARAVGGARTSLYNNLVRCDNVQHNLMGILKLLRRFKDEDFHHPDPVWESK